MKVGFVIHCQIATRAFAGTNVRGQFKPLFNKRFGLKSTAELKRLRSSTTTYFPGPSMRKISSFAILRAKSCLVKECGYGILPMWLEFCEVNALVP
jgi:hypothetical protein